ncbi:MAG TPA: hypothetical protein VMR70_19180 [Flavisolibacter sp.]|nr:hypothetical protein [Flavisolibacter sp.]
MSEYWNNLDILQLQQLYSVQSRELEYRLLHGASWQEVCGQRQEVTALAVAIYKRLNGSASSSPDPASHKGMRK